MNKLDGKILFPVVLLLSVLICFNVALATTVSSVTITVKKDGSVVVGAYVEVYNSDGDKIVANSTDSNGQITLSNVETGTYSVYVYYSQKLYRATIKIESDTTNVDVNLGYTNQFMATVYSAWWIFALIGGGLIVLFLFIIPSTGRRGRRGAIATATLFVFLMLLGLGMLTTGYLVEQGLLTAQNAALIGTFMVLIAAIVPMLSKRSRK